MTTLQSSHALLFLHAQTPMHPGSGTSLGVVDLPIQRERHTHWPVVAGSSLKGVLRSACAGRDIGEITTLFGPPTENAGDHAGSLSVTDARILAFPVRSLKGGFAWVTCLEVLERLCRDAQLHGKRADLPALPKAPSPNSILCTANSPLTTGSKVVLEEFDFTIEATLDTAWPQWLAAHALSSESLRPLFAERLVLLHQDDFTHFVRFATEICARIGLDSATKTTKDSALFYEEFLPAETLLYSVLLAAAQRSSEKLDADKVLDRLEAWLPPVLQIGGDETIGKGFCLPKLVR